MTMLLEVEKLRTASGFGDKRQLVARPCTVAKGRVQNKLGKSIIFYHTPRPPLSLPRRPKYHTFPQSFFGALSFPYMHCNAACVDINVIEGRIWRITKICLLSKPGKGGEIFIHRYAELLREVHVRKYPTFCEISFGLGFGLKVTNGHFPLSYKTKSPPWPTRWWFSNIDYSSLSCSKA